MITQRKVLFALCLVWCVSAFANVQDSLVTDSIIPSRSLRSGSSGTSSMTDGFDISIPQFTPKAPNTAGLVQAIDVPVSLYTGVPDISIPLYEIETDGVKIPISLSYHASGIRVAQEASWVGLGWSLNAGGLVSRTIRCGDDFYEYAQADINEGFLTAPEIDNPRDSGYFNNQYFYDFFYYVTVLKKDSEPDIFFYTLPGASGKFLIDKSRGVVLLDKGNNNVRIEYPQETAYRRYFVITTPDGTKYTYRKYETTKAVSRPGELNRNLPSATKFDESDMDWSLYSTPFEYTSSWMLTDVTTIHGRHVPSHTRRSPISPRFKRVPADTTFWPLT